MIPTAPRLGMAATIAILALSACSDPDADREAIESLSPLNVIDESGLNSIMLDFADPDQAVAYFRKTLSENPDRVDLQQGYARALMKANRPEEASLAYQDMDAKGTLTDLDRLYYAEALIQSAGWEKAEAQLDAIPPTVETYDRYRLEAMIADFRKEWKKADSFYDTAAGLTTRKAPIYNNWGISKMARGDRADAEEMFLRSITNDSTMFSPKNNLAISRAKRREYDLPVVPLTRVERAKLLHNIALQAIRNGDVDRGRGLLEEALETSPTYFEEAANKLEALNRQVAR